MVSGGDDEVLSANARVYRYLRQAIICGKIAAGTRIIEEQIAENLAVSRTPVREALQRLRSEGLLVRIRRGQLEVVRIDEAERNELHMLRVAVDEVVARLLTRKADTVEWDKLYSLLEPLGEAATVHGIRSPEYSLAHLDLHTAINEAAFTRARGVALGGSPGAYQTDDYVQQDGYEPVAQHRTLLDDLSSGDENRAVTAMYTHALRGRPSQDGTDLRNIELAFREGRTS
ncbi:MULTISPECIES: GntR family transcriptional regulator [Gordonia]|jgi:DNA-binding GntR family transcriptional regulator|uniref:Putative GntR family transcriptional regulator n=1 Tax=Gordonia alkanivorans NBRC 16433 TaxID=1027371 RepID=F9VRX9_9ACTN|nr:MULTISPECIES: GntR family transcriptional regulator [Gordonia]MDH3020533.1 GntR family transcriptional regulator [Gordonia alkanivorans]MDH3049388.1 GntR family transcriptional regulator [Gordonia alkanivorans]MDJ0007299.1 GntR family transcriptional regulator [Gordonia alkanivorans]MDJ0027684.1 GntR family transcriptional regulator [Gordonia alkanivorans]MDJ0098388.1 GntR family transcriptional regulator [Gordonia alkanivorans]